MVLIRIDNSNVCRRKYGKIVPNTTAYGVGKLSRYVYLNLDAGHAPIGKYSGAFGRKA